MALPAFLGKIVGWLRAGYPDGMPERDYIPLMALLGKHLASDEVTLIAGELDISAPVTAEEIKKAIGAITRAPVNDADTARSARTSQQAAGRWHRQTGADRRPGGRAGSAQNDHTPAALGAWPTTEPRVGAPWRAAGRFFAARPAVARVLGRWGHILHPVVLIALGCSSSSRRARSACRQDADIPARRVPNACRRFPRYRQQCSSGHFRGRSVNPSP